MSFPEVFVLRHGQTEWNAQKRYQGRLNSNLTVKGRVQAAQQGEILMQAGMATRGLQVFSSPQGRVQETADIALAKWGGQHKIDTRLVEMDLGKWQGLFEADIQARWPENWAGYETGSVAWYFNGQHGGETFEALQARVVDFLTSLDAPTVIVTHGITSKILRGNWLGLTFEEMCSLQGGQGCVYHLHQEKQQKLEFQAQ